MNRSPDQANDSEHLVRGVRPWSRAGAVGRLLQKASILVFLGLGFGLTLAWVAFLCWAAYGLLWMVIG